MRAAVKLWNGRLGPGLFGLGCSGGADSIALADAAIAEMGAHNVVVIHIDHGLSPGSAKVADEVAAWAREQGAGAIIRRVEVEPSRRASSPEARARDARRTSSPEADARDARRTSSLEADARDARRTSSLEARARDARRTSSLEARARDARRTSSLEARARDARYRAFAELLDELGLSWILLAHTARDQAETVLMRIVRGTGPAGLAGIPTVRPGFVRPLLEIPRETIDAYVAERGLPTWHDPMNDDESIARVRFRKTILPALRAENPALDAALVRLAASAREWMSAIDDLADPYAQFPIDCTSLVLVDSAVRKRAFALALESAGLGYDAIHLEQIDALVCREPSGEVGVDVPGGRVVRSYNTLDVVRPDNRGTDNRGTDNRGTDNRGTDNRGTDSSDERPVDVRTSDEFEVRIWKAGDRMKP
ncbi:MAG: tRNA lysidine(34) synthetase TilS, partial [Kofleriaceae bacterium]|nr:tRNA lysidine(34) synthetase TilS [Kofleriaceae bacterium]